MDTLGAREAGDWLAQHHRLHLAALHRRHCSKAWADFLDGDVIACEAKLLERERGKALSPSEPKLLIATTPPLRSGAAVDTGSGEKDETHLVAETTDQAQIAATTC